MNFINKFKYIVYVLIGGFVFGVIAYAGEANLYPATRCMGSTKIESGKALELFTTSDVLSLSIGAQGIADVIPLEPRRIRILGLKPGATNLIVSYTEKGSEEYEICVNSGYKVEVISGILTNSACSLIGW